MSDLWEVWKKIGKDIGNPQLITGVSGHQFEDYFIKLFKKQEGETPPTVPKPKNEELNNLLFWTSWNLLSHVLPTKKPLDLIGYLMNF